MDRAADDRLPLLQNNGVWLTEERIKLAFACLLTAVGIPQILAATSSPISTT